MGTLIRCVRTYCMRTYCISDCTLIARDGHPHQVREDLLHEDLLHL